jgi:signal transduction histidine kinase
VPRLLISVAKHAGTDAARVESGTVEGRVVVRVSDRGKGYTPMPPAPRPPGAHRGLGLISVRERLSLIGGTAEIGPNPGGGTLGVLAVPLAGNQTDAQELRP